MIPKANFQTEIDAILKEGSPYILCQFLKLLGVKELKGAANNDTILSWAREIGVDNVYKADSQAWCGLTMAVAVKRAGYSIVKEPLWALNWGNFGVKVKTPVRGDILTFKRFDRDGKLIGGHVCMYWAETPKTYIVLGGNQEDEVCFTEIEKGRLQAIVRPEYKNGLPKLAKAVKLKSTGKLSLNEA